MAGYLSLDTIVCPAGTFEEVPGGGALYAALGVRAAGARARLRARLCDDFPRPALAALAALGIDLGCLEPAAGPTRRARLEDPRASRVHPTERISPHHGAAEWWARTRALAPPPCTAPTDAVVITAMPAECLARHVAAARAGGALVVADTSEAFAATEREALLALLPQVDLFAPSREEVRRLLPGEENEAAQRALDARGRWIVQKRGPEGLWWSSAGQPLRREASRARTVADPTGAGDAAVGALAAGLARGEPAPALLREASAVAARAVAGIGPLGLGLELPLAAAA